MSLPKDPVKREEWCRKQSERMTGKKRPPFSDNHRKNISISHLGKKRKPLSDDHKRKIGDAVRGEKHPFYGKHHTQTTRDRISATLLNYHPGRGVPLSEDRKRKISESNLGKHPSEETLTKLSVSHLGVNCGANHPNWKGGVSFGKYCQKFNRIFRIRVRVRFEYKCVECGMTQEENGESLCVHHVYYDKKTCCKEGEEVGNRKFVTLCKACHCRTNFDREFWEDWFTEIINEFYGGVCYLQK